MSEPRTLTDIELADAETILAPAFQAGHTGYDEQVTRACGLIREAITREPDPARDEFTARRAAVILLASPEWGSTPFRCRRCGRAYYADPSPADWALAGGEDWVCWQCATAPGEAKAIESPAGMTTRMRLALADGTDTVADLASVTGCSRGQVYRALRKMQDDGEVVSSKQPGTRTQVWRLAGGR